MRARARSGRQLHIVMPRISSRPRCLPGVAGRLAFLLAGWLCAPTALLDGGQAWAGWGIDWAGPDGAVRQQDLLQANHLKLVWLGQDGKPVVALIVDLDSQSFSQVYYDKQYYVTQTAEEYVTTLRAVRKMALGLWPASPDLIEALLRAPPAERRRMETELGAYEQRMRASGRGQTDPAPARCPEGRTEGRRSGEQETIRGHPAIRYDVLADGKPSRALWAIWITSSIDAARELDPKKLQRFLDGIAGARRPCGPGGEVVDVLLATPAWTLIGQGYPVRIAGRGGEVLEVVKVERRAISRPELEPPAGFARRTFSEHIAQ